MQPPIIPGPPEPYTLEFVMPAAPEASRPTVRRWPVLAGAVILLVVAVGGIATWARTRDSGAAAPTPSASLTKTTTQVYGHLTLRDVRLEWATVGLYCAGDGGYTDIHGGAQVIITDSSGTTIGVDQLTGGRITTAGRECTFGFTVQNVALGRSFYGIAIGNRRPYQIAEADLSEPVELSLG